MKSPEQFSIITTLKAFSFVFFQADFTHTHAKHKPMIFFFFMDLLHLLLLNDCSSPGSCMLSCSSPALFETRDL